jgi:hypothetical protein
LVVVLSKASVASEWCKRELTAGLLRELEEKRVVVLPVLLESCEIPLFLRDKKYADFRSDLDQGLRDVLQAIARITNDTRSRIEEPEGHTDWAMDWGKVDGAAQYRITFVEQSVDKPYTVFTQLVVRGNEEATLRFDLYEHEGLDWIYRNIMMETLSETAHKLDIRLILSDQQPARREFGIRDEKLGITWEAIVESRILGEDEGFDVLLDVAGQLSTAVAQMRAAARKPTDEEVHRIKRVLATLAA